MQGIVEIRVEVGKVFKTTREGVQEYMQGILESADNSTGRYGPFGFALEKGKEEGVFLLCKGKESCIPVCICGSVIYARSQAAEYIIAFLRDDLVGHLVCEEPCVLPEKARRWLGNA